MTTLKTVTLAAVLVAGATSVGLAQNGRAAGDNGMPPASYKGPGGMPSYPVAGSTAANAAASGGGGTHQSAQKTGSAQNTQKVLGNQNGYAYNGMPPASYNGPGGMKSYPVAGSTGAQKTGSAENTQRVLGTRSSYRGRRRLYSYDRSGR